MLQILWLVKWLSYLQKSKFAFIEIINSKKSNIIIGCIYRHNNMHLNGFNNGYLNTLLAKLFNDKKSFPIRWLQCWPFKNWEALPN